MFFITYIVLMLTKLRNTVPSTVCLEETEVIILAHQSIHSTNPLVSLL